MSNAIVGALRVTLGLDSAAFENGLSGAQKHLKEVGSRLQGLGGQISGVGKSLSVGITAPVAAAATAFGAAVVSISRNITDLVGEAQTAGVAFEEFQKLKYVAEQNLVSVEALTDGLKEMQLRADELVQTGGGSAAEAFARLGYSAAELAEGLKAPEQLFEDIIGRLEGLDTAAQIRIADEIFGGTGGEQFVRLLEGGADGIQRLKDEFVAMGGVVGQGEADQMVAFQKSLSDLGRAAQQVVIAIATSGLLEFITGIAQSLAGWIRSLSEVNPGLVKWGAIIAGVAAAIGPLLVAIGAVVSAVGAILPILGAVGAALLSVPFAPVIAGVAAVVAGFVLFKDEIVSALSTFSRALIDTLGPKIQPLFEAMKGMVSALGEAFAAIFGGSGSSTVDLTFWGEVIGRIFGAAVDIITGAINVVTNILNALGALLRGDFSAMWGFLGQAAGAALAGIGRAFQTLLPEVTTWVRQTYEAVREWLVGRFEDIVRGIGEKVARVTGFFRDMYIAVVGNSFVPDMVREIGDWMGGKLRSALVDPAKSATDEASSAFAGMSSDVESQLEGLFKSISSKDWKGALGGIFGLMGKSSGKLGSIGRIGASLMGGLPGFKRGGSFNVGGSGTADSKLVAFRATPGERVDISTPRQQRDQGAGAFRMLVNPSPYFDLQVQKVAAPLAYGAAAQGADYARVQTQRDMQRRARTRLG